MCVVVDIEVGDLGTADYRRYALGPQYGDGVQWQKIWLGNEKGEPCPKIDRVYASYARPGRVA